MINGPMSSSFENTNTVRVFIVYVLPHFLYVHVFRRRQFVIFVIRNDFCKQTRRIRALIRRVKGYFCENSVAMSKKERTDEHLFSKEARGLFLTTKKNCDGDQSAFLFPFCDRIFTSIRRIPVAGIRANMKCEQIPALCT